MADEKCATSLPIYKDRGAAQRSKRTRRVEHGIQHYVGKCKLCPHWHLFKAPEA